MLLIASAAIYDAAARGFFRGDLLLEGGRIAEVSRGISARREKLPDGAVLDVGGRTVLPGLVVIHTHGRAGGDFGSADGAMLEQMLARVTFTMASRSCCSTGFGFSIRANVPSET